MSHNRIFLTMVALILPFTALADEWPGSFLARVEATALIETLNAELLWNPSATVTLERWCGAHRLAAEPKISAHLLRGEDQKIAPEDRQRLPLTSLYATDVCNCSAAISYSLRQTIGMCPAVLLRR